MVEDYVGFSLNEIQRFEGREVSRVKWEEGSGEVYVRSGGEGVEGNFERLYGFEGDKKDFEKQSLGRLWEQMREGFWSFCEEFVFILRL